ncbi:hypothetical protein CYMTET_30853 [Cymbomonas tetramitiformis]|uniref:Uncharacterized protein n=1 Tax=Cymbomonas tetramitiformis TaxID=36881 RepID=A0AAE0FIM6_9CHLO|nr:hypothetical protein CYMTET_30853 [Cymbomonas tetramitiformis]
MLEAVTLSKFGKIYRSLGSHFPSRHQHNANAVFRETPKVSSPCRNSVTVRSASRGVTATKRDPTDSRWSLDCPHFDRCAGCVLDVGLDSPPVATDGEAFFNSLGISFQLSTGDIHAWRCRVRLAVRGTTAHPRIGLFERNSHNVVPIPKCRVHHPRINQTAQLVEKVVKKCKIEPYSEKGGTGKLRYLQLTANTYDTRLARKQRYTEAPVQVVIVWNTSKMDGETDMQLRKLTEAIWREGASPIGIRKSIGLTPVMKASRHVATMKLCLPATHM